MNTKIRTNELFIFNRKGSKQTNCLLINRKRLSNPRNGLNTFRCSYVLYLRDVENYKHKEKLLQDHHDRNNLNFVEHFEWLVYWLNDWFIP